VHGFIVLSSMMLGAFLTVYFRAVSMLEQGSSVSNIGSMPELA
jgi:hypothetical protein